MRKIYLAIFLGFAFFLAFAANAPCSPFLICDPYLPADGITKFQVTIDALASVDSVPVANALKFDLSGVTTGAHTIQVAACNIWGCSSNVPFSFNKAVPASPANTRVAP